MPLQHLENAPLIEAVFELRFPGEPIVLTSLDRYYEVIRRDLPEVWVPNAQPGVAPALQPWEFKNKDGSRWIGVSINTFAAHVRDYKDYADFRSWALPLAESFCGAFQIKDLTRVGARYRNRILLLRTPGEPIPLARYLKIGFELPALIDVSTMEDIHLQFATRRGDAQIVIVLHHVRESAGQPEGLVLDLDCGVVDNVSAARLGEHFDAVHTCTEDLFAALASEGYMRFMKGETV